MGGHNRAPFEWSCRSAYHAFMIGEYAEHHFTVLRQRADEIEAWVQ